MAFVVGDHVNDFTLFSGDGKPVTLSDTCGVPHVFVFVPPGDGAEGQLLGEFADLYPEFAKLHTPVFAIRRAPASSNGVVGGAAPTTNGRPFPELLDADGKVTTLYDAQQRRTVVLDANARVFKIYEPTEVAGHAAQVLADVKGIVLREEPRQITQQAPVLLIPRIISPEFCKELIQVWETEGNEDSGFMKQVDGKTVGQYDYNHKIRRDHFVQQGSALHRRIAEQLGRRVVTEVFKAFNYQITRQEQIKIACYESSRGGYFRPHRDNTTEATAHRRFACSLLLNDDYEGGFVRFPEYAPHLYRPEAGGAVIFSCSLLHEATDVTAGRRFVLLTFFYGDKEAALREQYNKRVGGSYRA